MCATACISVSGLSRAGWNIGAATVAPRPVLVAHGSVSLGALAAPRHNVPLSSLCSEASLPSLLLSPLPVYLLMV